MPLLPVVAPPQELIADGFGAAAQWGPALVEIAVFAALIYVCLRFLLATHGLVLLRGLGLVGGVLFVGFVVLIQSFQLTRLQFVVELLAPSLVLGFVIVFHPEIRRAIVQVGDSTTFRAFFRRDAKAMPRLLRAVARLGQEKVGALIAIERDASMAKLAESGIRIDGELTSDLLESIFYPKSALHDGGVIVRGNRIVAASCLFPLSQSTELDQRLGTRHRAALGLSEQSDAYVVVVSEETGRISIASGGVLTHNVSLEELERRLEAALGRQADA